MTFVVSILAVICSYLKYLCHHLNILLYFEAYFTLYLLKIYCNDMLECIECGHEFHEGNQGSVEKTETINRNHIICIDCCWLNKMKKFWSTFYKNKSEGPQLYVIDSW